MLHHAPPRVRHRPGPLHRHDLGDVAPVEGRGGGEEGGPRPGPEVEDAEIFFFFTAAAGGGGEAGVGGRRAEGEQRVERGRERGRGAGQGVGRGRGVVGVRWRGRALRKNRGGGVLPGGAGGGGDS